MPMATVAEFEGVSKTYRSGYFPRRQLRAVDDVSLRIEPGQVVGLLGPNRSGKTTLVKLLLSLCKPSAGRVQRLDRPVWDHATLQRVGYVHESQAFPRYLRGYELLRYYGALSLLPDTVAKERATALLEQLELADRRQDLVSRYSKGMLQRLAVAQALMADPELLVLDEPTEGLDVAGRELIYKAVADLRSKGHSVLLVTHALDDAERVCDRVAILNRGRLVFEGPPKDVRSLPGCQGTTTLAEAFRILCEGGQP